MSEEEKEGEKDEKTERLHGGYQLVKRRREEEERGGQSKTAW